MLLFVGFICLYVLFYKLNAGNNIYVFEGNEIKGNDYSIFSSKNIKHTISIYKENLPTFCYFSLAFIIVFFNRKLFVQYFAETYKPLVFIICLAIFTEVVIPFFEVRFGDFHQLNNYYVNYPLLIIELLIFSILLFEFKNVSLLSKFLSVLVIANCIFSLYFFCTKTIVSNIHTTIEHKEETFVKKLQQKKVVLTQIGFAIPKIQENYTAETMVNNYLPNFLYGIKQYQKNVAVVSIVVPSVNDMKQFLMVEATYAGHQKVQAKIVTKTPFWIYNNIHKTETVENNQVSFLKEYKPNFILLQNGGAMPDKLKEFIADKIVDESTGDILCLLKKY